jgi:hypothetical protein
MFKTSERFFVKANVHPHLSRLPRVVALNFETPLFRSSGIFARDCLKMHILMDYKHNALDMESAMEHPSFNLFCCLLFPSG